MDALVDFFQPVGFSGRFTCKRREAVARSTRRATNRCHSRALFGGGISFLNFDQ